MCLKADITLPKCSKNIDCPESAYASYNLYVTDIQIRVSKKQYYITPIFDYLTIFTSEVILLCFTVHMLYHVTKDGHT